ncbi:MAG: NfeD family protein, partial [Actinomycetota bacterium]
GREWMIGEEGVVVRDVDPDGTVRIGGGTWMARTNRATPVVAGDVVRVAAIDGATLEVEPLEGAAQDYRERRRARSSEGQSDDITTDSADGGDGSRSSDHGANDTADQPDVAADSR